MQALRVATVSLVVAVATVSMAAPARAAGEFVEVNPETVQAGYLVGIRANCDDNTKPATVESEAFGEVTVRPQYDFLTAAVTVPADTDARRYTVRVRCPSGRSASTRLNVLASGRPSRGPATGFGGTAGADSGPLLITGGLAAIAAAAVLGVVTLRRRRIRA